MVRKMKEINNSDSNNNSNSKSLFSEAKRHIVGGVNSPVRSFKSVGGNPIFFDSAKGCILKDVDGNSYIDYVGSWGPMILGHGHSAVVKGLEKQIKKALSFGASTEIEIKLAELIKKVIPFVKQIRMVSSGTEATLSAVRLARGYTQKDKIIKFAGCYHGHGDGFLVEAGSGNLTLGKPNSLGVTKATAKETLIAHYNDIESVKKCFLKYPNQIAAVIIEPIAGNMGLIPSEKIFLLELKKICKKNKTLLIFDEVMSGFRVALGGAVEYYGIEPDLITLGKIIGGGMPVGAFAGKEKIMKHLAPLGGVYQAGTLSGNPVSMVAGYETLKYLIENKKEVYSELEQNARDLEEGLRTILDGKNIPHIIHRVGSMMGLFFTELKEINSFKQVLKINQKRYVDFFKHSLQNGVYFPPSPYETFFVSLAHGKKEITKTLNILNKINIPF